MNQKRIVNPFNYYFKSMFTNSNYILPPLNKLLAPSSQLSQTDIESSDAFEALVTLNLSNASGYDDISSHFLTLCYFFNNNCY